MDGGNTAAGEEGDRAPIRISDPGILRSVLVTWQGNSVAERLKTLGLLLIQQHKQRDQLHAYIDESGNTGANLFDPKQPHFFTVAMSSPTDFDVEFREDVERIARDLGVRYLHANEIGLKRVEKIAMDVVDVIERSQVRFHHVLVSKPDSAMFQFFYALFDPGENQAASGTAYWCRVLRFEMVVQLASIMELNDVRMFWDAMRAIRSEESEAKAMRAIDNVLRRVDELNDARVRELMGDTLKWARENLGEFSFWASKKKDHYRLLPNLYGLLPLFEAISRDAAEWKLPVKKIVHDQQVQFGAKLRDWHSMFRDIPPGTAGMFGDTPVEFPDISTSNFELADSGKSSGLQIVDLVLWIFSRSISGQNFEQATSQLLQATCSFENIQFVSLDWIRTELEIMKIAIYNQSVSAEQLTKGVQVTQMLEDQRQRRMR